MMDIKEDICGHANHYSHLTPALLNFIFHRSSFSPSFPLPSQAGHDETSEEGNGANARSAGFTSKILSHAIADYSYCVIFLSH